MKADDARKLTQQFVFRTDDIDKQMVESWLSDIYKRIEQAATKGMSELRNPFGGVRTTAPTDSQKTMIFKELKKEGFQIETKFSTTGNFEIIISW